jgi:hypothetical protein
MNDGLNVASIRALKPHAPHGSMTLLGIVKQNNSASWGVTEITGISDRDRQAAIDCARFEVAALLQEALERK